MIHPWCLSGKIYSLSETLERKLGNLPHHHLLYVHLLHLLTIFLWDQPILDHMTPGTDELLLPCPNQLLLV